MEKGFLIKHISTQWEKNKKMQRFFAQFRFRFLVIFGKKAFGRNNCKVSVPYEGHWY
jgi:hypothetical protein